MFSRRGFKDLGMAAVAQALHDILHQEKDLICVRKVIEDKCCGLPLVYYAFESEIETPDSATFMKESAGDLSCQIWYPMRSLVLTFIIFNVHFLIVSKLGSTQDRHERNELILERKRALYFR